MGEISVYDKIVVENQKEKIWNQQNFYINFYLKDGVGMEFTTKASWCQRERWHHFPYCDTYHYFAITK